MVAELTWFRRDVLVGPPGDRVPRREPALPSDRDVAAALGGLPYQVLGRRRTARAAGLGPPLSRSGRGRDRPRRARRPRARRLRARPPGRSRPAGQGRYRPAGRRLDQSAASRRSSAPTAWSRSLTAGAERAILTCSRWRPKATPATPTASRPRPATAPTVLAGPPLDLLATGPLVGALEARASLRSGQMRARIVLALHAGSPLLRCTVELENSAPDQRLRIRVPAGPAEAAVAGGPFGPVRRVSTRRSAALPTGDAGHDRAGPPVRGERRRRRRARGLRSRVLRVRARCRGRPGRDAASLRGTALPRRSTYPAGTRRLADARRRAPSASAVSDCSWRSRRSPGEDLANGIAAGRAVGGRLPSAARGLAAPGDGAGSARYRHFGSWARAWCSPPSSRPLTGDGDRGPLLQRDRIRRRRPPGAGLPDRGCRSRAGRRASAGPARPRRNFPPIQRGPPSRS